MYIISIVLVFVYKLYLFSCKETLSPEDDVQPICDVLSKLGGREIDIYFVFIPWCLKKGKMPFTSMKNFLEETIPRAVWRTYTEILVTVVFG